MDRTLNQLIQNFSNHNLLRFFERRNSRTVEKNQDFPHLSMEGFGTPCHICRISFPPVSHLDVFSIPVQEDLSFRSGKKKQYDFAIQILKQINAFNGIFVFYDSAGNFRFSFIYRVPEGPRVRSSNYRRFTYFVSSKLTNKTFRMRVGSCNFESPEAIEEAFSVEVVTKSFYNELADWYFWACQEVEFPPDAEKVENGRQMAVIRLITRLIFIWFMREKGLIPPEIFDKQILNETLKDLSDSSSSFYLAVLQNLFFTTLNTPMDKREFRSEIRGYKGFNPDHGNQYRYHHLALFKDPEFINKYLIQIPFLNGGLFDCLDAPDRALYIDGFSDTKKNQPKVPNRLFFSSETVADLNADYGTTNKTYRVKGLLEILSSYNFTIDENTLDDQEVALDPELLGRVFENLLASFNPETSKTARRATGSYYTPRQIVDFMVDESLKLYLSSKLKDITSIEEKLEWIFSAQVEDNPFDEHQVRRIVKLIEAVRVVDPAVGSGAFPMGILNRLVFILSKLDPNSELWKEAQIEALANVPDPQIREQLKKRVLDSFKEKNHDYGRKLYLIQKCIYGVDIQQTAVEIAKLRFFISLLVDENVDKGKDNWGIEPLPNLDFKIMQGNSLVATLGGFDLIPPRDSDVEQNDLFSSIDRKTEVIATLTELKAQYQAIPNHEERQRLKNQIELYFSELFLLTKREKREAFFYKLSNENKKYAFLKDDLQKAKILNQFSDQLVRELGFDPMESDEAFLSAITEDFRHEVFPWSIYFAEVFQDKGGFDIVIANPPYIGEKGNTELFDKVKTGHLNEFYIGKMDYFYFFFHLAIDLVKKGGIITFITTNYYPTATGAVKLRKDIRARTIIHKLINFNQLTIFENAKGQHNLITILEKGQDSSFIAQIAVTSRVGFADADTLGKIVSFNDPKTEYFKSKQSNIFDGSAAQIRLTGILSFDNNPVTTILQKISSKGRPLTEMCEINQGLVSGADKVTASHREKLQIKSPIGTGIFVLTREEVSKLSFSGEAREMLMPFYKNSDIRKWTPDNTIRLFIIYTDRLAPENNQILEYLSQFKQILNKRREVRTNTIKWWQLHWPRKRDMFISEKLLVPQRSHFNTFSYTSSPWFASADVYYITAKSKEISLKYILALVNSKVYYHWLYHRGKRKGEMLELYQTPLSEIPIPRISFDHQQQFIKIVDEILSITNQANYLNDDNAKSAVNVLEMEIDQLTYDLFDLNPDEIDLLENLTIP